MKLSTFKLSPVQGILRNLDISWDILDTTDGSSRDFLKECPFESIDGGRSISQSFIWIDECQNALLDLKSALFGNEVMAFPRFGGNGFLFHSGL